MAKKNLDKAVQSIDVPVEVRWKPFMIDPGTDKHGEDYAAYCERRWGGDGWTHSMRRKGAQVGAPFANWKVWPHTLQAHRLIMFAESKLGTAGAAAAKNELFECIYERGLNVTKLEVLVSAAVAIGLDGGEARSMLSSPGGEEVVAEVRKAQRAGVRSVPHFVVSGAGDKEPVQFSGAVGAADMAQIIGDLV